MVTILLVTEWSFLYLFMLCIDQSLPVKKASSLSKARRKRLMSTTEAADNDTTLVNQAPKSAKTDESLEPETQEGEDETYEPDVEVSHSMQKMLESFGGE